MAGRGKVVFASRALCHCATNWPGTIAAAAAAAEGKSDNPPASVAICAFVRSTLLLGSIAATSTTIAATSVIRKEFTLLHGPPENLFATAPFDKALADKV